MLQAVIVGFGNIGPSHAVGLSETKYGEIYGICDIQKERADAGADKYHCRAIYDFETVLSDEHVDVVHICTPHYLHKEMTIKALAAGKHVVLEKPVAINEGELQEILEAEKKSDKKVCVMFQKRRNPVFHAIREMVEEERYGKLEAISGFMTWDRSESYYAADSWRGKWDTEGGGVTINQSIHLLDMLRYIGGEIDAVCGSVSKKYLPDTIQVEDTVDALLFYKSGIRGCFYASNGYGVTTPFQLIAEFEHGRIRYSDNLLYEILPEQTPRILMTDDLCTTGKSCWGFGHTTVINEFYQALTDGTESYLSLQECTDVMHLLFAIYESAKNHEKKIQLLD